MDGEALLRFDERRWDSHAGMNAPLSLPPRAGTCCQIQTWAEGTARG